MITFDDIQRANATIKTIDIKGKEYAMVNQRIKAFRMLFPDGFIRTQILSLEDGVCVMQAVAGYYAEDGTERVLGTGTAYEKETSSFINRTSFIENCESSAVGRSLSMMNLGVNDSVASFEEVANAINNQNAPETAQNAQKRTKAQKADNSTPEAENGSEGRITDIHWQGLKVACKAAGISPEELLVKYQVAKPSDITMGLFRDMMDYLEKEALQ